VPEFRKDPGDRPLGHHRHRPQPPPGRFQSLSVIPKGDRFCPFCPGNEQKTPPEVLAYRQSGGPNEPGWTLRVVPNKFPALRVEGDFDRQGDGLYDKMNGIGAHEVIIEAPSTTSRSAE